MIYENQWNHLEVVSSPGWATKQLHHLVNRNQLICVGYEYLLPNGEVCDNPIRIKSWYDSVERKSHYDYTQVYRSGHNESFQISEVLWRFKDKPYQKVKTLLDIIQVGDFIRAKSRAGDWRKVITIDPRGSIFGQGYHKPIDDPKYAKLTSSENSMVNISQVVRDGKKLYGK